MTSLRPVIFAAFFLLPAGPLAAADTKDKKPTGPVSYYRDIRPVFQQHCQGCHQPARPMGGYIMTSHADLLKAGDRGQPGVAPGKPDSSVLFEQVLPKNGKAAMPKAKPPLSAAHLELIKRWIAEGAKDDTPKTAIDTVSEKNPPVYKLPPVISSLDFSPDGKLIAVSGYHEVLLHKADGSGIVARLIGLSERIQSLAFSPDGKSLAVAGGSPGRFGEIQIWDVEKKKLRQSVSLTYDTLYGVSWSPDGSKIAVGCPDNTLRAIDATNGKQILYQGAHADWVLGTAFSTDGRFVVSVSRDMTLKLTEVATQRFIDNVTSITPGVLKGGLSAVARRPFKEKRMVKAANAEVGTTDEKVYDELLIGGSDGTPRIYKMHREVKRVIGDDANKVREFKPMPGRIFALRFNAEGQLFAAGSSTGNKGELRVYQSNDGKLVSTIDKIGAVYTVAFSPDGKTLASAGFDGNIVLSDPTTGKVTKTFVAVPLAAKETTAKK